MGKLHRLFFLDLPKTLTIPSICSTLPIQVSSYTEAAWKA